MAHKAEVHDAEYHKILKDLVKREICLNQLLLTEKVQCPLSPKRDLLSSASWKIFPKFF